MRENASWLKVILSIMVLSDTQQGVINVLASSSLRDRFYWTGGTLLAEQYLHHRRSDDIDLFSDTPFSYEEIFPLVSSIKEYAKLFSIEEKKVFDRWEFFLHNKEEVRVEFVHYDFPKLEERTIWQGVFIDSLDDLAANKTMALVERREPKDAVDIYFLMKKKRYSPTRLLRLAQKKFGLTLTVDTFLSEALFACKNLDTIKPMLYGEKDLQEKTIKDVQSSFERLSAGYLKRYFQEEKDWSTLHVQMELPYKQSLFLTRLGRAQNNEQDKESLQELKEKDLILLEKESSQDKKYAGMASQ